MTGSPPSLPDFEELEKYYPGSKRTRRAFTVETPKPKAEDEDRWDAHPYVKMLNGKNVEFFTIGALAKALGKSEVSLRKWEDKGYIPAAPFRLPKQVVHGKEVRGRRLYTRELIEATVSAFKKRGLMGKARIEWKDHSGLSIELLETWSKIHAQLTR